SFSARPGWCRRLTAGLEEARRAGSCDQGWSSSAPRFACPPRGVAGRTSSDLGRSGAAAVANSSDWGWGRVYGAPMTATTEMRDAPARGFSRPRVMVVLLLMVGVAGVAWWVTHPRVFAGVGDAFMGPVPVGTRAYVGMEVIPQDGMVFMAPALGW